MQRAHRPHRDWIAASAAVGASCVVVAAGALAGLSCSASSEQAARGNEPINGGGAQPASEVPDWNAFATDLVLGARLPPPLQVHVLAVTHIAVHDALNAIDRRYEPYQYAGSVPGASAPAAVAAAAHDALLQLVSPAGPAIDAEYNARLASIPDGPAKEAGIAAGRASAAAILSRRGVEDLLGALLGTPYAPGPPDPGVYQPTPPTNNVLLAGWGAVIPFALASQSQFRSPPPLTVDSGEYAPVYEEVKSLGAVGSTARTAQQTETARFWYDAAAREWQVAARKGLADVGPTSGGRPERSPCSASRCSTRPPRASRRSSATATGGRSRRSAPAMTTATRPPRATRAGSRSASPRPSPSTTPRTRPRPPPRRGCSVSLSATATSSRWIARRCLA